MENDIIDSDLCINCANYMFDLKCLAFPKGIPEQILTGLNDHSEPIPGQDNDIVFEVKQSNRFVRPICFDCKHFNNDTSYTCKAFPESIPDKILLGKNDHSKPLPGQGNDIVFEGN